MPENKEFGPFISDYFHHGWRKFWILMIWNALKWRIWTISSWLKEFMDFFGLKCPKNEGFEPLISDCFLRGWTKLWIFMVWNATEWRIWTTHLRLFFIVVEGNCWFLWSEMPQNEGFEPLISDYFHRGWKKLWIFVVWNATEWRIWTSHLRLFSPRLKEILDSDDLECPKMKDLDHSFQINLTMVEENFGFWWFKMPQNAE